MRSTTSGSQHGAEVRSECGDPRSWSDSGVSSRSSGTRYKREFWFQYIRDPERPWSLTEIQLLRFSIVVGLIWSHFWKIMGRSREYTASIGESVDEDHDMLLHHVVDPGPLRIHSVSTASPVTQVIRD